MNEQQALSNIQVSLSIPGQKVMASAMDVFDKYQPIVNEALQEAKTKLLFDEDFQSHVKDEIIKVVEQAMKKGIEDAAKKIVSDAYWKHYQYIEHTVRDAILDKLNIKED